VKIVENQSEVPLKKYGNAAALPFLNISFFGNVPYLAMPIGWLSGYPLLFPLHQRLIPTGLPVAASSVRTDVFPPSYCMILSANVITAIP
jgi:hypothetical protein